MEQSDEPTDDATARPPGRRRAPAAVTVRLDEPAPAAARELARDVGRLMGRLWAEGRWSPPAAPANENAPPPRPSLSPVLAALRDAHAAGAAACIQPGDSADLLDAAAGALYEGAELARADQRDVLLARAAEVAQLAAEERAPRKARRRRAANENA